MPGPNEELIKRLEADCNSLNAIANRPDIAVLPCFASLLRTQHDIAEAIDILKGE